MKDLRLSLENPKWAKMLIEQAQEYKAKGLFNEWVEANGFNEEVLEYIDRMI